MSNHKSVQKKRRNFIHALAVKKELHPFYEVRFWESYLSSFLDTYASSPLRPFLSLSQYIHRTSFQISAKTYVGSHSFGTQRRYYS